MAHDFDFDDIPESFEGFDKVVAGNYHFEVSGIDESGGKNGSMWVDCEVLAGSTPNQEGKSHREYFTWPAANQDPKAKAATAKRVLQFAIAVGLTTEEELKALKAAGKRPAIDFNLAVGRQFVGKLTEDKYEGKVNYKLGYDFWPIGHPSAAGIPLNAAKIAKAGDNAADPLDGLV